MVNWFLEIKILKKIHFNFFIFFFQINRTDYSVPQNKRALKTQRGARGNGMSNLKILKVLILFKNYVLFSFILIDEPTFSVYEDNQSNGKPDLSRIRGLFLFLIVSK